MKLLFVCTGNTCRSPMAQAIAKDYLNKKGISAECDSAGVYAVLGQSTSPNSVKALENVFGIRGFSHDATPLTRDAVETADLVIAMTENHKTLIRQVFGESDKIIAMPVGIGDPFGGSLAQYENCARAIQEGIEILFREGYFHA